MCDKPYTSSDKWTVSIISGLLFLLVSSPYAYAITGNIASRIGLKITDGGLCPNLAGLMIHAAVFTVILRMLMSKGSGDCSKPYTSKDKWIISMIGGLMFLLISSPFLYEAVDALTSSFGLNIADEKGCPNLGGLIVHTSVFILVTRLLMR
jgi:hypothetical protein